MTNKRQFFWISSTDGNVEALQKLDQRMQEYYSQQSLRANYQEMIESIDEIPPPDSVAATVLKYICGHATANSKFLEVGCGNGRFYRQLRHWGFSGSYTGIEMAEYVIESNRRRHPEVTFFATSIYELSVPNESYDFCLLFYVLEHLVYPERAINEAIRTLVKGGKLILVFPDFVATEHLPSQQMGFSPGSTREKLKKGRYLDALVTLYDSRIRVKPAIRKAGNQIGPFPVNLNPVCLNTVSYMSPDIDATYIASKKEVYDWAVKRGLRAEYPNGVEGPFRLHSFVVITK